MSKTKTVCEGGEDLDEKASINDADYTGNSLKKKGGCGHRQPVIKKEGLSLIAVFKSNANDVFFHII